MDDAKKDASPVISVTPPKNESSENSPNLTKSNNSSRVQTTKNEKKLGFALGKSLKSMPGSKKNSIKTNPDEDFFKLEGEDNQSNSKSNFTPTKPSPLG
mmetsp:Transcript_32959/g.29836  ORF Transcript_32959/g.29836 Transcript_32959/m.29836 type:complete len:99 (+) Transcript_32959:262-558(+)